jgi:hypothetical protein
MDNDTDTSPTLTDRWLRDIALVFARAVVVWDCPAWFRVVAMQFENRG